MTTALFTFLDRIEKKPSKALSQNFLIDQNITDKLIDLADLQPGDVVLEIGPGTGAITKGLLKKGASVIAVEKDFKLARELKNHFLNDDIKVIEGDILDSNLNEILPKKKKVKVVSNLPFQLTSPILAKLLPLHNQISELTLIMQKDVVERILAKPHSKTYSSLSIFTHLYAHSKRLFDISHHCFFPKPKVTSSALKLYLKRPLLPNDKDFIEFVRKGFNQRRKMLSSSLPFASEKVQETLHSLGLSTQARPENLSIDEWIHLFQKINLHPR